MKMSLFTDPEILPYLGYNSQEEVEKLIAWLQSSPSFTTFRVNVLKPGFTIQLITDALEEQGKYLNCAELPQCRQISADCVLVERWRPDASPPRPDPAPPHPGPAPPRRDLHVIVDAACGAAVLRGAHVFAPGVMGMPTNVKMDDEVSIYADVEGKCKRGLKVPFEGNKVFVGFGLAKMTRAQLFENSAQNSGIAIEVKLAASRLPALNSNVAGVGAAVLQNLPSVVCGWAAAPARGDNVLDMCAAPGNKTTHLAELCRNQATIIALDKSASRVEKMKENCLKHGATSVRCYVQDSTKCCSERGNSVDGGPPFAEESFDKILLDAPCSALGQRPQFVNQIKLKMLKSYKFLQRELFSTAVRLLKPGGSLIYSTCSINKEENECLVAWALSKFPCLVLAAAKPICGGPGRPDCGLDDQQRLLVQRFGPEDDPLRNVSDIYRDTVGFFIAKFIKK